MIARKPWADRIRAALRAAAMPVLALAAMIVVASAVVAMQEQGIQSRVDQAVTQAVEDARRDTAYQYELEVEHLRAELEDAREARDACRIAADEAGDPIYAYYASEEDAKSVYGEWLPLLDECTRLAPDVEEVAR